jgi:flagellar motor switch/type III secretory pathway protein FliN
MFMKAASKEESNSEQVPVDPFAVDMFAPEHTFASSSAIRPLSQRGERETQRVNQSWHARLPRVNANQFAASAALTRLRPETCSQINDSVINVISRYSMTPPEQISVSLIDLQENDLQSETLNDRQSVFANFTVGPEATAAIELDVEFAARLVDRMLGGDGASPEQLRPLTTTERAVIEFLLLSSVSELNTQSGEPLARLQSIENSRRFNKTVKRGLVASVRIAVGEITGLSRVYLNRDSLTALDEAARRSPSTASFELPRYERFVSDLALTVLIGKTDVAPHDLLHLEPGDVMVVDIPAVRWRAARLNGSLFVRVSDGDDAWLIGELSERAETLAVNVSAVNTSPPSRFAERLKMEEVTENVEAPDEELSLMDSVMVSVRVELAARRFQLDELSRLRKNQILELGCNATDPVDLVVDGRRIAAGELVDIEGRLGVRITKVLS